MDWCTAWIGARHDLMHCNGAGAWIGARLDLMQGDGRCR